MLHMTKKHHPVI